MKIVSVVGARPQFIKAAAVSRVFLEFSEIDEKVVHTGQHFDAGMSDIFFDELGIPEPAARFDISGGTHGAMTGRMLMAMDELLSEHRPDLVLVYGDTNSTLAGALSAAKMHIPVAHVEAGLRSFNMKMPEEINRILTDNISRYLYCPTDQAVTNLTDERYDNRDCDILLTGDVMLDAMQGFSPLARKPDIDLPSKFALATVHRAENTDEPDRLAQIVSSLNNVQRETLPIVMPLHPRTRNAIASSNLDLEVTIIDPVGYLEMLWLLRSADLVLTDSGGLQKEAYFCGKPCITLRDETEWVELVEAGANFLTGAQGSEISKAAQLALELEFEPNLALFGGGNCAKRIAEHLTRGR